MMNVETVERARDNSLLLHNKQTDSRDIPMWPFKYMAQFLKSFLRDKWHDTDQRIARLRRKLCEAASHAFVMLKAEDEEGGREKLQELAECFSRAYTLTKADLLHVHAFCARLAALLTENPIFVLEDTAPTDQNLASV